MDHLDPDRPELGIDDGCTELLWGVPCNGCWGELGRTCWIDILDAINEVRVEREEPVLHGEDLDAERVETLRQEAGEAGDNALVVSCDVWLHKENH